MRDGFVRVACGTPALKLADTDANANEIIRLMREAANAGAKLLALPELCLTGYTCLDLLLQHTLQKGALDALGTVLEASLGLDLLTVVGLPLAADGRLYNCAAALKDGRLLGIVPKRNLPNYAEFQELRYFSPGEAGVREITVLGQCVPFGGDLLFQCDSLPELVVGIEICEDLWVPDAPGVAHALSGATVICNLSASSEGVGKPAYREMLVTSQSSRLVCGYLYADAGQGESTTDLVFSGNNLIAENGQLLAKAPLYTTGLIMTELDVRFLSSERYRMNIFGSGGRTHTVIAFTLNLEELTLSRRIDPAPFVPSDDRLRAERCEQILNIQAQGLAQRMRHIGCKRVVLGVSGGLDSTLAMLVAARALKILELPANALLAVTMPCFGTTDRTLGNAQKLTRVLGAELRRIDIAASVTQHFQDIGHDMDVHDVTYENGQARERTQVLMDIANQEGGLVVGTGDMSELALGWATYNGDHMSMYGVNAGVPKTLVRHLVQYAADQAGPGEFVTVLRDILDTPVSPELLPPVDGVISQRTEDVVGPYALHDFFLYHMLRRMEEPAKVKRLAVLAFEGEYDERTIDKWLTTFVRRFFSQQFKRSCLPDGPKVGSVSVSPRGDLRMPSDAVNALWIKSLQ